ncbi:MAG: class I SAM-dependent methyltransferase [Gammaproteobacteria bacterium]|nr:class I SAM-dependent methyltransferase [Gammaproteobacteria bacterium]
MGYDPAFPRVHYDGVADKEWTRLTRNRRGELNFLVHMDVLRRHITADMDVLEIGAGAGIYTKELLHMARRLVVSDLSEVQLALNQDHMRELGVLNQVDEYRILDLADLGALDAASFDAVVCVGGPLSYLLDKESEGLRQMLRVVKAGGIVVLGVMSLINTLVLFMGMLPAEKQANGIDNLRWMLETGFQDREHSHQTEHYCHMMTSADVDVLLANEEVDVVERRAAGMLGIAGEDALNTVREDEELWALVVERELAWSKLPGTLDLGDNIVYVIRKR